MSDSTNPYVQIGSSGLFVYRVGLGTMQFGWSVGCRAQRQRISGAIRR